MVPFWCHSIIIVTSGEVVSLLVPVRLINVCIKGFSFWLAAMFRTFILLIAGYTNCTVMPVIMSAAVLILYTTRCPMANSGMSTISLGSLKGPFTLASADGCSATVISVIGSFLTFIMTFILKV